VPPVKKPARVARTFRLPPELIVRLEERAARLGMDRTAFVERALEAALGGSTPAGVRQAGGAETRAPASPRAPVDPGVARAEAFRRARLGGSGR
jgi:hypothetical protein